MKKSVLNVDGMMCQHCVQSVTKAVNALPGVSSVEVNLEAKTVAVEHDAEAVPVEKIRAAIEDQGYDVV